jgi:hypothetical protein
MAKGNQTGVEPIKKNETNFIHKPTTMPPPSLLGTIKLQKEDFFLFTQQN